MYDLSYSRAFIETYQAVTGILETASNVVNVLTGHVVSTTLPEGDPQGTAPNLEKRKQQFLDHTTEFFARVKKLSEDLSKQADALEDAGIIFSEQSQGDVKDEITNGGFGNLDVGILNARMNDPGSVKEAEIYEEAVKLLASINQSEKSPS